MEADWQYISKEYIAWIKKHGTGRNDLDLRFGQRMCNELKLHCPTIFYEEDASVAFQKLLLLRDGLLKLD